MKVVGASSYNLVGAGGASKGDGGCPSVKGTVVRPCSIDGMGQASSSVKSRGPMNGLFEMFMEVGGVIPVTLVLVMSIDVKFGDSPESM